MAQKAYLPLVSIIIPAYNAETRIADTLACVIAQDYPNIEIVVVNDCSTDRSAEIARYALERGGRPFKFIEHTTNRGVSAARNTGIEASSGELLCFVDADDIAEQSYISQLQTCITENGADIALCGRKDKYVERDVVVNVPIKFPAHSEALPDLITCLKILNRIDTAIYSMMIAKKFVVDASLAFVEGCTAGEDGEFQIKAFARARKISLVDDCPYIYVHHPNMGSVRDVADREKKLFRYSQLIGVDMRLADYLEEHSSSEKIKYLAKCLLRPEGIIRMFSVAAKRGNRSEFERLLADKNLMEQVRPALKMIFTKPEIFFKAALLLYLPNVFYNARSKA